MVQKSKTKTIHCLRLKKFLVENGLEPLEEIESPFCDGFSSWVFENTKELRRLMDIYCSNSKKNK